MYDVRYIKIKILNIKLKLLNMLNIKLKNAQFLLIYMTLILQKVDFIRKGIFFGCEISIL